MPRNVERIMNPDPEYMANHRRVHAARGPANRQACVGCGNQAKEWSHTHNTDPTDPENYRPRCHSCHQKYDNRWNAEERAKVSESVKRTWDENPGRRIFSEQHLERLREARRKRPPFAQESREKARREREKRGEVQ